MTKTSQKPVLAWHFLPHDKKLSHGDQRQVRVGKTLSVKGEICLCENGLHASRTLAQAARHASSNALDDGWLCRVEVSGDIHSTTDKLAGRSRTVLAMVKCQSLGRMFNRYWLRVELCTSPSFRRKVTAHFDKLIADKAAKKAVRR